MKRAPLISTILAAAALGCVVTGSDLSAKQIDMCTVPLITTLFGKDGPLNGCRPGDVVHFQIDTSKVAYSAVAARYCDMRETVLVERQSNLTHLVCVYLWK